MERALTLFSLEMDICRFVQHGWGWRRGGVMIELIGGGQNFLFLFDLFIYLSVFCLNCPPCLSPPGGVRLARRARGAV